MALPAPGEERILANMNNASQVVAASPDGKKIEYWAVAAGPQSTLVEVLRRVPKGWMVTLAGESLNPKEAAVLDDVRPFEVRKLGIR